MAENKLFKSIHGWDTTVLPLGLGGIKSSRSKVAEALYPGNTSNYSSLHRDVTQALLEYCGFNGEYKNFLYGKYAIVKVTDTLWAAERELIDGTHEVASYSLNGDIKAAKVSATGRYSAFKGFGAATDDVDLTTVFMAILPAVLENGIDCEERINELSSNLNAPVNPSYWYLNDAFYVLIRDGELKTNIPSDGNFDLLSSIIVKSGSYNGEILAGAVNILAGNSGKKKSKKSQNITMKEAKLEFAAFAKKHNNWTEEEKMLIPTFPDDYPVMAEALKFARRYLNTSNDIRPMRNFLWRGITSYGKSTGVEQMACMLNLPLVRMTCSSDMEKQEFLSDLIPDTSTNSISGELPNFETIKFDPEGAYYTLTGIKDENATPDMCLKAYGEAVAKSSSSTPRFKYIESDYVKALTRGYICEIQECSRIKDSGVLVGLNEYDRPNAVIPLVDGSHKKRHPDAMVMYTDNTGYVSCRPMCPSVIRRMAFAVVSNKLEKQQVISRIEYNTKYDDKKILNSCYELWCDIQKFCKEHDINEGPVSVTELEMLVQCIKNEGLSDIRNDVIECIVNKATSDEDEQADIIQCIDVNSHGLW